MINETFQDFQLPNIYNYSFKSNLDNKTLIFIYQITCKDPNINENYIGQTECFEKRKYSHSRDSQTSELKIYKTIREHGGWDNWEMKIINHYYCNNEYEARQIEQKYIDIFKATMNSVRAYSKSFINEELDRQLEFEINDYSDKTLGCYLYDYYLNFVPQMECEFCNKIFSSKSSLNNHQKTTKYCLKLQEKNEEEGNFICEYCNKKFTLKTNLLNHHGICKEKELSDNFKKREEELQKDFQKEKEELQKDFQKEKEQLQKDFQKELKEKDEEINELKQKIAELNGRLFILKDDHELIKEIAKQPKTTTNNTTNNNLNNVNNIINITTCLDLDNADKFKNIIKNSFNIEHALDGQKGISKFVKDKLLKDNNGKPIYICTDPSRYIFKYKDDKGEIRKDVEAKKLTNYIVYGCGITTKAVELIINLYKDDSGSIDKNKNMIIQNILEINNNIFKKELASLTSE